MKLALILASIYGALGVLFGALGAHYLQEKLSEKLLASWETGVRYQLLHALALLAVAILLDKGLPLKPTIILFGVGTLLFSGSIYMLCLKIGPGVVFGPMTPIGGLTLIAGWITLLVAAIRL